MAEKVADTIIQTLPEPKPITTIQQAPMEVESHIATADDNGYQIPVGFRNYEDE